jgi:C-terminal processing protease CtpA/Prc
MKKILLLGLIAVLFSFILTSCEKDSPVDTSNDDKINPVSQFVYDGMSTYYLWANEVVNKKPTVADADPEAYFYRILNSTDSQHGWSWITDDVQSLLNDFSGTPKASGAPSFTFMYANSQKTQYYAIVNYVFPNTPASNAGLKRLDIIGQIDGQPITDSNFGKLYGSDPVTFSIYKLTANDIVKDRDISITPTVISTNPVLLDSIYEIGDKKIGYLFYTDFISEFNNSLFQEFSKLKTAGITDLILDLRYNHGGAMSAAVYLASLIAPSNYVQSKATFVKLSYNSDLNNYFDSSQISRSYLLGEYDTTSEQNPLTNNLDLPRIYIIATYDSYSAAELTTFCLKPYINVVHIGNKTGGKYTASWTLHAYDDDLSLTVYGSNSLFNIPKVLSTSEKETLKNWAMQPIVALYSDKYEQNFSATDGLIPAEVNTFDEGFGYIDYWTQLGDTKDVFLGHALYLITGDASYKPVMPTKAARTAVFPILSKQKLNNPKDFKMRSVILDNIKLPSGELRSITNELRK